MPRIGDWCKRCCRGVAALARADSFDVHLKQIIASNIDQLLIVASWRDPQIWFQMIDEYLIGAERNNLKAMICINKVDLAKSLQEVVTAVSTYQTLGHTVFFTSAELGIGIEEVREVLYGQTTVLAGLVWRRQIILAQRRLPHRFTCVRVK